MKGRVQLEFQRAEYQKRMKHLVSVQALNRNDREYVQELKTEIDELKEQLSCLDELVKISNVAEYNTKLQEFDRKYGTSLYEAIYPLRSS